MQCVRLRHGSRVCRTGNRAGQSLRLRAASLASWRGFATSSRVEKPGLPIPRLDYKKILDNAEQVSDNVRQRLAHLPPGLPDARSLATRIAELHEDVRSRADVVKNLRTERNQLSRVYETDSTADAKAKASQRANEIRNALQGSNGLEAQLAGLEAELLEVSLHLPNDTCPTSPVGGYEACKVVQSWPENFETVHKPEADHVELLSRLGWLALPVEITGPSWPYLVAGGAQLEMCIVQYALSKALQAGFELVLPPDVIKSEIMRRCGFNPRDGSGDAQTYFVNTGVSEASKSEEDQLALAATSEVPMAAYFMNNKPSDLGKDLPKRHAAFGHAFRAEAGARGRESRGLYRVHQFSKVELFAVTTGNLEASQGMLDEMTALQWDILSELNLPLRLLDMSTEELGASAYRKFDIESWMPGRGAWGELASASNCTDYQARRLAIRHNVHMTGASDGGKKDTLYCHTLNATAAAVPRLIVALVENGAVFDENGAWVALRLPKALRKFWLGKEALEDMVKIPLRSPTARGKSIDLVWS